MTIPSITLRQVGAADVDRVESLLEANGLPHQDVRAKSECFFLAFADEEGSADAEGPTDAEGSTDAELVGIGGVETRGSNGLLRSVVVTDPNRGQGYGMVLCDALEGRARADGVETLYLLTTTASAFFRRRGYESVARERVPSGIRQTTEFADLCPSSATCMKKDL